MKKILCMMAIVLAMVCIFTACNFIPGAPTEKEDVVTVEDGYLVVNGVKTEYKVDDGKEPEVKEDVISVENGYLVVNGNKTDYQVKTDDVIEVIDGYVVVNGVKTDIYVPDCNHSWTTVTTNPTCSAGGYDTKTCSLCGKSVIENETAKLDHSYATTYSFDDNNHWFGCTGCDAKKDTAAHTPDADNNCSVCGTPLAATPGVIYDISADGTYAEVVGYDGTATKVKIASEYKGLPVKNIFDEAFKYKTFVTYVTIPDTVVSIGYRAFYGTDIHSLVIPDSVVTIGRSAFAGDAKDYMISLKSVVIGNSVKTIGDYAFDMCVNLSSLVFGDSVEAIGQNAFSDCNNLISLEIPDSVTTVGGYAFSGCDKLSTVVIGSGVKTIGYRAFSGCYELTSVEIEDGVENIGGYAFADCHTLQNITIPDSVTNIGGYAFSNCHSSLYTEYDYGRYVRCGNNPYAVLIEITNNNLSSYTINENTKVIASYVFGNCPRLISLTIPDNVVGISDYAFTCNTPTPSSNTLKLESIIISSGVRRIGTWAFYDCTNLKNVYYTGNEKDWGAITICSSNGYLITSSIHYNYVPEE